jgi:hypothetical protein
LGTLFQWIVPMNNELLLLRYFESTCIMTYSWIDSPQAFLDVMLLLLCISLMEAMKKKKKIMNTRDCGYKCYVDFVTMLKCMCFFTTYYKSTQHNFDDDKYMLEKP